MPRLAFLAALLFAAPVLAAERCLTCQGHCDCGTTCKCNLESSVLKHMGAELVGPGGTTSASTHSASTFQVSHRGTCGPNGCHSAQAPAAFQAPAKNSQVNAPRAQGRFRGRVFGRVRGLCRGCG